MPLYRITVRPDSSPDTEEHWLFHGVDELEAAKEAQELSARGETHFVELDDDPEGSGLAVGERRRL